MRIENVIYLPKMTGKLLESTPGRNPMLAYFFNNTPKI
jgi:hypothetical protein